MIERKNALKIIYEGKEKEIEIKSSLKEIKQEFIQQFNITKDFPIYFYYQINNDYNIILNDNSFSDFIESNITKLFAEKEIKEEKENIVINNIKIKSGLDLFIQEFQNEINKVKVKKIIIISKECEIEYKLVNDNEKNLIKEIKDEIEKLRKENNNLKEKNNNQSNIINSTKQKEIEIIKKENEKLLTEIKKLEEIINIKNREEKELKKKIEDLILEKNNLENETKNLQYIIKDYSNKENKNEEILKQRLVKMRQDYLSLQEKYNSKFKAEIKISNKFNINIIQKIDCYSNNSSNAETTNYKSRASNKSNKSKKINEKRKIYIDKINKIYNKKMKNITIEKKDNNSDESDNDNYYINSSIFINKEDGVEKIKKEEEECKEKYKLYFFKIMKNKK